MKTSLGFYIGGSHYAREIDLETDRDALLALGSRCVEYLRQTMSGPCGHDEVLRQFLRSIKPSYSPAGCGVLLGIFRTVDFRENDPTHLMGLLYFTYPRVDPRTWHIELLLLEGTARGQGLGTTINAAFADWAAARGAQRLTVTVCEANRRALRFWRDRLRYVEAASISCQPTALPFRRRHELGYQLLSARSFAPWVRLKAA